MIQMRMMLLLFTLLLLPSVMFTQGVRCGDCYCYKTLKTMTCAGMSIRSVQKIVEKNPFWASRTQFLTLYKTSVYDWNILEKWTSLKSVYLRENINIKCDIISYLLENIKVRGEDVDECMRTGDVIDDSGTMSTSTVFDNLSTIVMTSLSNEHLAKSTSISGRNKAESTERMVKSTGGHEARSTEKIVLDYVKSTDGYEAGSTEKMVSNYHKSEWGDGAASTENMVLGYVTRKSEAISTEKMIPHYVKSTTKSNVISTEKMTTDLVKSTSEGKTQNTDSGDRYEPISTEKMKTDYVISVDNEVEVIKSDYGEVTPDTGSDNAMIMTNTHSNEMMPYGIKYEENMNTIPYEDMAITVTEHMITFKRKNDTNLLIATTMMHNESMYSSDHRDLPLGASITIGLVCFAIVITIWTIVIWTIIKKHSNGSFTSNRNRGTDYFYNPAYEMVPAYSFQEDSDV